MTRPTTARAGRGLLAVGVAAALTLAAGCAASTTDDVVAGASTTGNPQTPVVDNPTTTTTASPSSTVAAQGSTTTTDPAEAATTSIPTSATSVPAAVAGADDVTAVPSMTMQLFWVRPPSDPRPLDLPGYRDPETGSKPLVVYGSATNTGTDPVSRPHAIVAFLDASGQTVQRYVTAVRLPGSTTAAEVLAPGETGDVIVVIEGASADQLADLTPELQGATAG